MTQQIRLRVEHPCAEKFEDFQPTQAGGFCQSCQKEVIDFTKMSDQELINYFKHAPTNTCGHFRASQLSTYTIPTSKPQKRYVNWLRAGLLSFSLFSMLPIHRAKAQQKEQLSLSAIANSVTNTSKSGERTVFGVVTDEIGDPLPGVYVSIKGASKGTVTDIDGKFQIRVDEGAILVFAYIGYISQEMTTETRNLSVSLQSDDLVLEGAVQVDHIYSSKHSLWQRIKAIFRKKH